MLFVINTGEVVFRSASQAMVSSVVPRARLERANGWLVGGTTLMQQMIAGPLGGFLFVLAACVPFFVNAGTYAASAIFVGLVAGTYRASSHTNADGDRGVRQQRSIRAELAEGFSWLAHQRVLRTMTVLIGLLNLTLTAATAVLVLLAKERLHLGAVGYGTLFTCEAAGGLLGSACGSWLIKRVTATWTIRIGLLIEAGLHLTLATSRSAYVVGFMLFAFGVHGALVDDRGKLAAAAADATGDARPGRQHEPVHRGRRQLRRRRARRRDRGQVRDHRPLLGRVRGRGHRVGHHLAGLQPGNRRPGICGAGPGQPDGGHPGR